MLIFNNSKNINHLQFELIKHKSFHAVIEIAMTGYVLQLCIRIF